MPNPELPLSGGGGVVEYTHIFSAFVPTALFASIFSMKCISHIVATASGEHNKLAPEKCEWSHMFTSVSSVYQPQFSNHSSAHYAELLYQGSMHSAPTAPVSITYHFIHCIFYHSGL